MVVDNEIISKLNTTYNDFINDLYFYLGASVTRMSIRDLGVIDGLIKDMRIEMDKAHKILLDRLEALVKIEKEGE